MKYFKWLSRSFYLMVIISFAYLAYKERDLLSALYQIHHLQNGYYIKKIEDSKISYHFTKNKPSDWVSLNDISKKVQGAIIVSEDGSFYKHSGYDPISLRERINDLFIKNKRKKLKGGSTITQQLVKNLFLSRDKTLDRKMRELFLAIYLEKNVDKTKILETYLNVIEYGKDLYGIHAASDFYFKRAPKKLSAREGAFLAMLLPNPVRYSRSFKNRILSRYARRQVFSILVRMKQNNYLGTSELIQNLNRPMSFEKINFSNNEDSDIISESFFFTPTNS